jgi:copper chaperone
MTTLKFKTNINCGGCVAKVTPFLNDKQGVEKWNVDTENPDKVLTIETCDLTSEDIIDTIQKTGFRIEPVKGSTE